MGIIEHQWWESAAWAEPYNIYVLFKMKMCLLKCEMYEYTYMLLNISQVYLFFKGWGTYFFTVLCFHRF